MLKIKWRICIDDAELLPNFSTNMLETRKHRHTFNKFTKSWNIIWGARQEWWHICVYFRRDVNLYCQLYWVNIGSDNGLLPILCQAFIWTDAWLLPIGPLGKTFSETLIKTQNFSFTKMHLKISSAKRWLFYPGWGVGDVPQNVRIFFKHIHFATISCNVVDVFLNVSFSAVNKLKALQ